MIYSPPTPKAVIEKEALAAKREEFAKVAMLGLLSADHEYQQDAESIASMAVDQADAMLRALARVE